MYKFVQIPKRLFYTIEGKSIFKITKDPKTLLVMDYLYANTNKLDITKFTLQNMIEECGYRCSTKKGEMNEQFKNILVHLKDENIIQTNIDFHSIKPTQFIICKVSLIADNEAYTELLVAEKEKILHKEIEKLDNVKLLNYFLYIKSRIYRRNDGLHGQNTGSGALEVCFIDYKRIREDLGLSDEIIKKYNTILIQLDLIRIGNAGTYRIIGDPTKTTRESVNIYALYLEENPSNAYYNIQEQIKSIYENPEYECREYVSYSNCNHQLDGEYGSLVKKEKLGTMTEKERQRMEEIIQIKNGQDEEKWRIKYILDKNPNKLLSNIYYDMSDYKNAPKYEDIEQDFGIVDSNGELLLDDFESYKWVMMNYDGDQERLQGFIKKHKITTIISDEYGTREVSG